MRGLLLVSSGSTPEIPAKFFSNPTARVKNHPQLTIRKRVRQYNPRYQESRLDAGITVTSWRMFLHP